MAKDGKEKNVLAAAKRREAERARRLASSVLEPDRTRLLTYARALDAEAATIEAGQPDLPRK